MFWDKYKTTKANFNSIPSFKNVCVNYKDIHRHRISDTKYYTDRCCIYVHLAPEKPAKIMQDSFYDRPTATSLLKQQFFPAMIYRRILQTLSVLTSYTTVQSMY